MGGAALYAAPSVRATAIINTDWIGHCRISRINGSSLLMNADRFQNACALPFIISGLGRYGRCGTKVADDTLARVRVTPEASSASLYIVWVVCGGRRLVELTVPLASCSEARHRLNILSRADTRADNRRLVDMLIYAALFLIIALAAALLGFSGLAAGAAGLAKILFWLFLAISVVSLIVGWGRRSWR